MSPSKAKADENIIFSKNLFVDSVNSGERDGVGGVHFVERRAKEAD